MMESLRAIRTNLWRVGLRGTVYRKTAKSDEYFLPVRGVVRWCAVCGEEHVAKVREDDERSSV